MRHQHTPKLHPCGHQKRRSNAGRTCHICERAAIGRMKRAYATDRTRWKKCEHPRNAETTYTAPDGKESCRECRLERAKQWRLVHDDPRWATHKTWKNPPVKLSPHLPVRDESGRSYALFPAKQPTRQSA